MAAICLGLNVLRKSNMFLCHVITCDIHHFTHMVMYCGIFSLPWKSSWGKIGNFYQDKWITLKVLSFQPNVSFPQIMQWISVYGWRHTHPANNYKDYRQVYNIRRTLNCWSLRCSWSTACGRCSNYIFILDLTPGFNVLGKDNCNLGRETFKCWDLVQLVLEILR